jgi:hypothetical protein
MEQTLYKAMENFSSWHMQIILLEYLLKYDTVYWMCMSDSMIHAVITMF